MSMKKITEKTKNERAIYATYCIAFLKGKNKHKECSIKKGKEWLRFKRKANVN